jgi:DNA modification methylase
MRRRRVADKRARRPRRNPVRDRIIELRRIRARDLRDHPRNWRQHPARQRQALRALLSEIGYADALLAREEEGHLVLVDGHLRRSLDPDQVVPVLVLDVSAEEADKLLVTLDPLTGLAGSDPDRLSELLDGVATSSAAVRELLDAVARGAHLPARRGLVPPDTAPPLPAVARSRVGDLWILGSHRLLCGDATKQQDVSRLLAGARPLLTVTDPPYGVDYDPAWRERAARKGQLAYAARRVGEVANDDRADWREAWNLCPSDVLYCWHAGRQAAVVQEGIEAAGFEVRAQIIWSKPHVPISRGHYHWRHEPCWYAVRKGASAHWCGDRTQTTVWEMALDPNAGGGHATQKPVEAMERPIRNHDSPSVYDPFLGSGTTLIACERAGRQLFGMEIDPRYVDVSVSRWEQFTGQRARRGRRGQT